MQEYSTLSEVRTATPDSKNMVASLQQNFCFKVYIDLITGQSQHKEKHKGAKHVSTENILTISDELELFHTLRYNRRH